MNFFDAYLELGGNDRELLSLLISVHNAGVRSVTEPIDMPMSIYDESE